MKSSEGRRKKMRGNTGTNRKLEIKSKADDLTISNRTNYIPPLPVEPGGNSSRFPIGRLTRVSGVSLPVFRNTRFLQIGLFTLLDRRSFKFHGVASIWWWFRQMFTVGGTKRSRVGGDCRRGPDLDQWLV